jgi:type II secretion system protein G
MRNKGKGFTLIELLIVVAIIGIIAAIAIPNLLVAMQKGKQKATVGDMNTIGHAVESYITDFSIAPQVPSGDISGLNDSFFVPFYVKLIPVRDGWGSLFQWAIDGTMNDNYSIISWGRDRTDGGPMGVPVTGIFYTPTVLADFNNDIVFSNGIFTFGPRIKSN